MARAEANADKDIAAKSQIKADLDKENQIRQQKLNSDQLLLAKEMANYRKAEQERRRLVALQLAKETKLAKIMAHEAETLAQKALLDKGISELSQSQQLIEQSMKEIEFANQASGKAKAIGWQLGVVYKKSEKELPLCNGYVHTTNKLRIQRDTRRSKNDRRGAPERI